jgi:hypothetical protein
VTALAWIGWTIKMVEVRRDKKIIFLSSRLFIPSIGLSILFNSNPKRDLDMK